MQWQKDGSGKADFGGLVIEADQFQFPDGTVLGGMQSGGGQVPMGDTTINITIDRVVIDKAVFKAEADACEDTTETPEPLEETEE